MALQKIDLDKAQARVTCLRRTLCFPTGVTQGFIPAGGQGFQYFQTLLSHLGQPVLRALAENDSGWKQIIPQVAVVCGDRVLFHDIPDTAGETRLSGKSTYFIGGHMDDQETDILAALAREMHEEIGGLPDAVLKSMELFHLGFVNDESSDVGAVHFGVVFVAKFKPEHADTILPELRTSEDGGVAGLRWATIEELESAKLRMTNWALMTFPEVRRFVRHGIREGHVA